MGLDLYKPDYEQTVRGHTQQSASTEQLVNDMGELTVLDPRRRDTFPVRIHFVHLHSLPLAYHTEPSQCRRAFQRDRCRRQGTLLRRPHPLYLFQYRKAQSMTPHRLASPTEL